MQTYLKILYVLKQVYAGQNLNLVIQYYKNDQEIGKIRSISYGVIRNYFLINFTLSKLIKRIDLSVLELLQIAIFELLYSQKKNYAITNDMVNLVYEVTNSEVKKKFINGVLREFIRQKAELIKLSLNDYSLKYNIPNWMITKLKKQQKENYLAILNGFNHHPAFGIRLANTISIEEYTKLLTANNISYGIYQEKFYLTKAYSVNELPGFKEGLISVQDIAAQFLPDILNKHLIKFKRVLDSCAAPGGKSCQLLENYNVELTALELDTQRILSINENLARTKLKAKVLQGDAGKHDWWDKQKFDLIVADVPCSATGTIKRNPDIKINRLASDLLKFQEAQRLIVLNLWDMLETNGYLLYITCSIFSEENQENLSWFNQNIQNFRIIDELQIFPTKFCDSLYYALVQKIPVK